MKEEQQKFVCVCRKSFETQVNLSHHKTHCKIFQANKKQREIEERETRRLPNGLFKCDNPDCTNEHDGSYGSGRFCSKHCRCSFNSKKQTHFPTKEELAKRTGFGRKRKVGGWKCDKCGKVFETRTKLRQHIKDAKHPNNQGWSKGLTKETDSRIANIAKLNSIRNKEAYASGKRKVSKETRLKISIKRKQFLLEHPEKHPSRLVCNTKENMTYPEQLVYGWLAESNIEFIPQFPWKYHQFDGSLHRRYVDFYLPKQQLFIEIDGKFWHKDTQQIDLAKDKCALRDGIQTVRLDPNNILEQLIRLKL